MRNARDEFERSSTSLADDKQPDAWLDGLSDDARCIWTDEHVRASALGDIARAWRQGDSGLDDLVEQVDRAVVEGLAALGFPRGPIEGITFEDFGTVLFGRKRLNCRIIFYGPALERVVALGESNRFFSAWIHESIHARQPYELGATAEYQHHRGFEEGLVEGLTRYVLERALIQSVEGAFSYYVAVYEQLAHVLGTQVVELWKILWRYPAGAVRDGFVRSVDELCQSRTGERLAPRQRARLLATATGLLDRTQDRELYDVEQIRQDWERAL